MLGLTLHVGWQHRRYASDRDPKEKIADEIMDMIVSEPSLRSFIYEDQEDNVRDDLCFVYDDDTSEEVSRHAVLARVVALVLGYCALKEVQRCGLRR